MNPTTQNQGLFTKLSLEGLAEDKKRELIAQLDQLIEARVALAVSERLSEEANKQLEGLVDTGTPEQALDLIKQNISDYDGMVGKIAQDTLDELVNNKDAVLAEVEKVRAEVENNPQ